MDYQGVWPVKHDNGTWGWCVVGEVRWELGKAGSGMFVTVPDGFVTDLATIPKWLQWALNPDDPQTAQASIIHDYLLSISWEQRVAVGEFYRALVADGVPLRKRQGFFSAVLAASSLW